MRIAAWAVIAATTAGTGAVHGATVTQRLALYDSMDLAAIVWGQESAGQSAVMDPPYFTAERGRVEVLMFPRYTDFTWQRAAPLIVAWRASLPDRVTVRRMPKGIGGNKSHPYRDHWEMHQRVYFAGELAGIEDQVHAAMADMIGLVGTSLGSRPQVARLARTVGADPEAFAQWVEAPIVEARVRQASTADWERMLADTKHGAARNRRSLYPAFVINGRYVVSADAIEDPGRAFRVANRIIRQELEADRAHDGPTNDAEFAEWMAPREGEIFWRERFGKRQKFRGVYSHGRRELWELDDAGAVTRAYRLTGEGDRSYFQASDGGDTVRYAHVWRHARQYVPIEGEAGPQRYGRLPAHRLAYGTRYVVGPLAVQGPGLPDGVRSGRPRRGSHRGRIGVRVLVAGSRQAQRVVRSARRAVWPWQEAAAHVGFEPPAGSVAPWRVAQARTAGFGDHFAPEYAGRAASEGK